MNYILILITGVYFGDVASPTFKYPTDDACKKAGATWVTEARGANVRSPRFVCLPHY